LKRQFEFILIRAAAAACKTAFGFRRLKIDLTH
jgi:hypothetical protein